MAYITYESNKRTLPGFVKFNATSLLYTIEPTSIDIVKKYSIQVEIRDTMGAISSY